MRCPFCNEDDFDLIGLKIHFLRGHCEVFEQTISPEEESRLRQYSLPSHDETMASLSSLTVTSHEIRDPD